MVTRINLVNELNFVGSMIPAMPVENQQPQDYTAGWTSILVYILVAWMVRLLAKRVLTPSAAILVLDATIDSLTAQVDLTLWTTDQQDSGNRDNDSSVQKVLTGEFQ